MANYSILSYLDGYKPTTAKMNGAPVLTFGTASAEFQNLGYENQVEHYESGSGAILRSLFKVNMTEGANYYIYSSSYFDPYVLSLHDANGSFIAVDNGTKYGSDSLLYTAPYTGTYYVDASWNQGSASSNKFVYLLISEDITSAVVVPPTIPVPVNAIPTLIGIPTSVQAVFVGQSAELVDFQVADTDADFLTVSMVATNGTIEGLVDADLNAPGVQLTGPAATINVALAGAKFTATSEGSASILVALADGKVTTATSASYTFAATQPSNLNLTGTPGDDVITGGTGADSLNGLAGNDMIKGLGGDDAINGGNGVDTAAYSGNMSAYTIKTGTTFSVASQLEGTDFLSGIERLAFADGKIAFDLDGNAGAAALLIGTVMGKAALKDKAVVGTVIGMLDAGATIGTLSELVVSNGLVASLAGGADNTSFVKLLMRNVLGSDSDATLLGGLTSALDFGFSTQASMLATASQIDATKMQIDLVGLTSTGIDYL